MSLEGRWWGAHSIGIQRIRSAPVRSPLPRLQLDQGAEACAAGLPTRIAGEPSPHAWGPRLAAYRGRLSRVQGVSGPDGYYVQHLYWSLKHAEENFLPTAGHPDVLILYAEDVDGPAVARAASKLTKSAVVAQLINFKRTAPGYENATTAFTTCWEGNDWVRSASKEVCVAGLYPCRAPPPPLNQSVNFLNMNYGGEAPLPSSRLVTCDPCRPLPCILAAFIHTMWSLPVFKK